MKAAVIDSLGRGPRFADFAEPVVADGETPIELTAAGLHTPGADAGQHLSTTFPGILPMIPGIRRHGPLPGRHPRLSRRRPPPQSSAFCC